MTFDLMNPSDLAIFTGMVLSSPITARIQDQLGKMGLSVLEKLRSEMSERLGHWLAGKLVPESSPSEQQRAIQEHLSQNPSSVADLQKFLEGFSKQHDNLMAQLVQAFKEQQEKPSSERNYDFRYATIKTEGDNSPITTGDHSPITITVGPPTK